MNESITIIKEEIHGADYVATAVILGKNGSYTTKLVIGGAPLEMLRDLALRRFRLMLTHA